MRNICMRINQHKKDIFNPIVTYTSSDKSAKHLGVIFPVIIESSLNASFSDGKCKFVNIDSLKNIDSFESWSEIILDEIINIYKDENNENLTLPTA